MIGTVLSDRYRVDSLLGEGAMGRVYLAEHVLMRKRVALKVLHPELTAVPEIVQRFEREARAAAHIEHPNVAAGTDFGRLPDGSVFLVLEYVEGRALSEAIAEGPMAVGRALHIALQMASALEAAHALGIVHRDLKPDNVLLVENERTGDLVKVLDFGIAKVPAEGSAEGSPITQIGMVYGTPEYMAPEQALGQDVDGRADLFALGVVLYEMLAGVRPYAGAAVGLLGQQLTKPLPLIADRASVKVPPRVEGFVRDLMQTDLTQRVSSALQTRQTLEALFAEFVEGTLSRGGERSRYSLNRESSARDSGPRESNAQLQIPVPPRVTAARRRSARTLLLGLGAGVLGVVGSIFAVGAWSRASESAPLAPASSAATVELELPEHGQFHAELEGAEKAGLLALGELVKKYPTEAQAHKKYAYALAVGGRYAEAVDASRVALALDPTLNEDGELGGALYRAAQSKEASAAAFRLLRSAMGSEGANVIYALYEAPQVSAGVKGEALKFLRSDDGKALAEPALSLAIDLMSVKDCEAAARLVKQAALVGDSRALPELRRLQKKTGCGTSAAGDCYPCLRESQDLALSIDTIEKRSALREP
ncbi:MAG TPA: serine/threonine-protein kinase [Polyangiaceae bacterium]|nr:serine/threonine-protein kinase [Polyangiaceae bacterium]